MHPRRRAQLPRRGPTIRGWYLRKTAAMAPGSGGAKDRTQFRLRARSTLDEAGACGGSSTDIRLPEAISSVRDADKVYSDITRYE